MGRVGSNPSSPSGSSLGSGEWLGMMCQVTSWFGAALAQNWTSPALLNLDSGWKNGIVQLLGVGSWDYSLGALGRPWLLRSGNGGVSCPLPYAFLDWQMQRSGYHGSDVSVGDRGVSDHLKKPLSIPGHDPPGRVF